MTKVLTTKINALFLTAILIAGTFTLMSPSFTGGAQALQMDNNNYKKSFGKDSNIKCNNINVNVNGFTLDIGAFPEILGSEVAAAETETGTNSFENNGNNGPSGSNSGFVFVCINNNNNSGAENGDNEETDPCENCFTANLDEAQVQHIEDILPTLGNGQIKTIKQLCEYISTSNESPIIKYEIVLVVLSSSEIPEDDQQRVFDCLEELGLIDAP